MPLKKSGHLPFTEKPLRELKNSVNRSSLYEKGENLEKLLSKKIHQKNYPVLVSSKVLRSYNCGQIDLCHYSKGHLILYEAKCYPLGIGQSQNRRLLKSLTFLISVFNASGEIVLLNHLPKD